MTDRELGLVLQLISDSILDTWMTLNNKVVSSKGNRPVWKITTTEDEKHYVDELQGLLAQAKRLKKLAEEFRGVGIVVSEGLDPTETVV